MTSTEIMTYIKYYSTTKLLEASYNSKFNPNDDLRATTFMMQSIIYNNFDAFKILINHPNFNKNKVNNQYIDRILTKLDMCDIPENRKFLEELYNHDIEIRLPFLPYLTSELGIELFDKANKSNLDEIKDVLQYTKSLSLFEHVLKYTMSNFPNLVTKEFIDNNYLRKIHMEDDVAKLIIIYNLGFDVSLMNNSCVIPYILNIRSLKNSNIFTYLVNKNIIYNEDIIKHVITFLKTIPSSTYSIKHYNIMINMFSKLHELKTMFPKFNEEPTDIIYILIDKLLSSDSQFYTYIEHTAIQLFNIIDLCVNNLKNKNPFDNLDPIFFTGITTKSTNLLVFKSIKDIMLRLIYYKFPINHLSKKFLLNTKVLTQEEIDDIDNLALAHYKAFPSTIEPPVPKQRGRKKKEIVQV